MANRGQVKLEDHWQKLDGNGTSALSSESIDYSLRKIIRTFEPFQMLSGL